MILWLIWVAVLGFKERTGFDLAEQKPGLILLPIRPCVPAHCPLVFYFDFGFFEPALEQECRCCVSDTTVTSSQPECTEVQESTFLLGDWGWTRCQQTAHVCIFPLHQLKLIQISPFWESVCQEIYLDGRAWEGRENVSPVRARCWRSVTFCQVRCLTAVLGCVLPATGLTSIMKPITVTGN